MCRNFVAFVLRRSDGCLRLGVVASRRVGGAVARNRAKRMLREAFRRGTRLRPVPADVVLVARRNIVGSRYADVASEYAARVGKLLERGRESR